ncbi:MAG: RNA-guided endonuclease InsQ/TnpB family protein, partial [Armatimonadota bacterium]
KTATLKVCEPMLSKAQRKHLDLLFLEAKWLYNWTIADIQNRLSNTTWKQKEVEIKVGDAFERRKISHLSSQMWQGIIGRIFANLKALKALKGNGQKVGRLKFKSEVKCIPLVQYGNTFKFVSQNKVKIQGMKKPLRVRGLKQIPEGAEVSHAYLVRKPSGFYVIVTYWVSKEEARKPHIGDAIGVDLGVKKQVTFSNGLVVKFMVKPSERLKALQRGLSKKQKGSKNYRKCLRKIQREYERLANIRKDVQNRIVGYLKHYQVVCYQKDSVKDWARVWGRQVSWTGIGGITSRLGNSLETPIALPRSLPTTQTCSFCGYVRKKGERLSLSERFHVCPECGVVLDRDLNAARSIVRYGLATLNRSPAGTVGVKPVEWEVARRVLEVSPHIRLAVSCVEAGSVVAKATA